MTINSKTNMTDDGHMTDFDRFGKITASLVSAILRVEGETRSRKWAWRVITGREKERHPNWDMERGVDHEQDAIASLELEIGMLAMPGGFINHPAIEWLGASPDGFIRENGYDITGNLIEDLILFVPIEAKCPRKLHTCVPPMYYSQMQIQLECCDAPYGYFVSWVEDSPFPYIYKVERSATWWDENYPVLEEFYRAYVLPDIEPPTSKRRTKHVSEHA